MPVSEALKAIFRDAGFAGPVDHELRRAARINRLLAAHYAAGHEDATTDQENLNNAAYALEAAADYDQENYGGRPE